ncbi:Putative dihydroorotase [Tolypocladium paradoxum]|uniref:dihydroorotase n=1 Tax=Tolypocladium paradoxum TaxID=94208 RepID=A0A2S4L9D2_9HYPO|nr:Putative dihydroorotase [Tolypocladium paradoxum]
MPLGPFELPAAADFHVHLRDGPMSAAVAPTVRRGGVNIAYVMPNLVPPVTGVSQALEYKERLEAIDPSVTYLMTLYLHESITPEVVREAKKAGISGIKSYPAGVTTNSSSGVLSYEPFYPVFAAMEECGLVLNLHGEIPSDPKQGITILNAESKFLPTLKLLHSKFPKLRIVLEHCSTKDAVEAVKACGDTVVGTLTCHHLFLTVDDWAGEVFSFCKPVAKTPEDRTALLQALVASKGKFFLGTDSAPHDIGAKKGKGKTAAGVFTQPYACQLTMTALEEAIERGEIEESDVTQELLEGFLGGYGRRFYGVEDKSGQRIRLSKGQEVVSGNIVGEGVEVVPFRSGRQTWTVEWI